ncbi:hypothetical protein V473_00525 [Sphingobium cupriresistens LL01]|uniref:Uncharacterized protein n=1 Tax=Sphingobium cupriresistens LL01 TaxID=1420583 RepID=A0A0J7Y3Z4_9SPHN|nr:hypothetical protein V473_00525 [Sphingobium cupriresistens LL01]
MVAGRAPIRAADATDGVFVGVADRFPFPRRRATLFDKREPNADGQA